MKNCKVDGCEEKYLHGHGYCVMHYKRWWKYGDPLVVRRRGEGGGRRKTEAPAYKQKCSVPECDRAVGRNGARGWCATHWKRWANTGTVELKSPPGSCEIPGCKRGMEGASGRGMCAPHYQAQRSHGDPLGAGVPQRMRPETRARYEAATPAVRADLYAARTMRELDRRKDVDFYLARAETHGRPLTRLEKEFADGVRMLPDRERDQAVLAADVDELTKRGLNTYEISRFLGVHRRTVVRHRSERHGEVPE